jgi:hypothetical protein
MYGCDSVDSMLKQLDKSGDSVILYMQKGIKIQVTKLKYISFNEFWPEIWDTITYNCIKKSLGSNGAD